MSVFGGRIIEELEEENERRSLEVSLEEKIAMVKAAKQRYGKNWRDYIPKVKSGIDWQSLKFRLH